jgi:hypothetical protein
MSAEAIAKANYRDAEDLVIKTARNELKSVRPDLDLCLDARHRVGWEQKTFKQKVDSLVHDSVFWGGHWN